MPARFDDSLPYHGNEVIAKGPLHSTEEVKEICAWVYEPVGANRVDAAATEMTTNRPPGGQSPNFASTPGVDWILLMERISAATFQDGRAFAVAVALIADINSGEERVTWWGQPVDVIEDKAAVNAAKARLPGPSAP